MDYKIMYEQAIKRAKAMISVAANQEEVYNGVITIFPELKESEDERIRKDLLGCLHTLPNHFSHNGSLVTEWIAWLEKQGEQKPVVIPKFRVGDFVKDANYHGEPTYEIVGMDGECYICQYRGNKSMGDRSVMHFCFDNPYLRLVEQKPVEDINGEDYGIDSLWHAHRILEKTLGKVEGYQSDDGILEHECAISAVKKLYEQKPAWSEEGKKKLDRIYYILGIAADEHAYSNTCRLIGDKEAIELQDFLRSIAKPEQKSDWSEEDEVKMKELISYLVKKKSRETDGYAIWLKSLKDRVQPQPKQEWSEEDKMHVHSIISTIECCRKENERSEVIADAYTSDLEWFKSLMNRCKPSEDLPHWKKGTLKGKNVTGFNSDFFSHNGYYINYNELFDKLPKDE